MAGTRLPEPADGPGSTVPVRGPWDWANSTAHTTGRNAAITINVLHTDATVAFDTSRRGRQGRAKDSGGRQPLPECCVRGDSAYVSEFSSTVEIAPALQALAGSWSENTANERAAFQTWMIRFCEASGVARPDPPTDAHRFELPIRSIDRDGLESTNFIDYWKAGHVAVEAKVSEPGRSNDLLLRRAYGQVRSYVAGVGTLPPYLMVVDVPKVLIVWDRWSGSYGDFAAGRRIALSNLHERLDDIALLQDILARPGVRDPRGKAQAVTKEIAGGLARLAAVLRGWLPCSPLSGRRWTRAACSAPSCCTASTATSSR